MDDPNANWRYDSGIFRALGGVSKKPKPSSSHEISQPDANAVPAEILNFGDIRSLVEAACGEYAGRAKPVSLFMIAIDEMEGMKKNYGDEAAAAAKAFVLRSLLDTRNEIFGAFSKICLGEYIEGRYLMLLPGVIGASAMDFAEILRKNVNDKDFVWYQRPMRFSISIGVAHKPGHAGDQDYMIMQADQACSITMSVGGNKVTAARISQGF